MGFLELGRRAFLSGRLGALAMVLGELGEQAHTFGGLVSTYKKPWKII